MIINTRHSFFIILLFFLGMVGCNTQAEKIDDAIISQWKMTAFLQNDGDVSKRYNPNADRAIEFKMDGTYNATGGPFPPTSGKYTLEGNELHMQSDEGPSENAKWKVATKGKGNKMIFTRVDTRNAWKTEIHYERMN